MKNQIIKCTATFFVLILFSALSYAWNFKGHVVIAEIAYVNLLPDTKKKVDELADMIFYQLPYKKQNELNTQYKNVSHFAKLAGIPDSWRKLELRQLFRNFHAQIPKNLLFSFNTSTDSWHFMNLPYPATNYCNVENTPNIAWALNRLEENLLQKNDKNTRALLMVFTEHLIGDIHQPLHTITYVDNKCRQDKGGNLFCLKKDRKGQCVKTLHRLWDSAVEFLNTDNNVEKIANQLQTLYPKNQFSKQELKNLQFTDWIKENEKVVPFIYSTPKYMKPSLFYYQKGQTIAQRQLTLAGYRLAKILNNVL